MEKHETRGQIFENGLWSKCISITEGVRQGCPLSPLIFNMALEPLAIAIRIAKNLERIRSGSIIFKIGLYADDIVCYLSHPESSMKALRHIVQVFGLILGFKVNSILCGFWLTEDMRRKIQDIWPGQWQNESIK